MDKKPSFFSLDDIPGLPFSLDAEQSALGCALLDGACLNIMLEALPEEAFYYPLHRVIYAGMAEMFTAGTEPDAVLLLEKISPKVNSMSSGELRDYLLRICQVVPTLTHFEEYAGIIKDKYYLRRIYSLSKEAIDHITGGMESADSVLEAVEQKIYELRQGRESKGLVPVRQTLLSVYDEIEALSKLGKKIRGLSCGFKDLDLLLSGLNKSDLIVLAARPSVGKSAFAINIAANVAEGLKKEGSVCIFSLEMSKEQVTQRLIAEGGSIDLRNILTGQLTTDEWSNYWRASAALGELNIYIDDSAAVTANDIKARVRQLPDVKLVIIDYLQLMSSGKKTENRVVEVGEMTRSLKIMAKELNIPVIVLSQLTRSPDKRTDKRPLLSDLRESGSIEQDADVVMFLHREGYYDKQSAEVGNMAECIVEKNRQGATGTISLYWEGAFQRFSSVAFPGNNAPPVPPAPKKPT